jgi:hypothetical protein
MNGKPAAKAAPLGGKAMPGKAAPGKGSRKMGTKRKKKSEKAATAVPAAQTGGDFTAPAKGTQGDAAKPPSKKRARKS